LVVGTHDAAHTGAHGLGKRPEVQLVHGPVVEVGGYAREVGVARYIAWLAEVFLFVEDVVFCGGDDACVLETLDGLSHCPTCEIWIWGEALPVSTVRLTVYFWDLGSGGLPSASGVFAEGAADGEETYIYALAFELLAHHKTSLV